jgi:hypothetical protein
VAFQENIQISLADIMDLKIGWNGSKEEIALQEEFHGISPRHHCYVSLNATG